MASGKQTTIFRQLIFNIAIPTLMALLVFAVINFQRTRLTLIRSNDERNTLLANEVTKVLKFQDIAINLIDDEFNSRLKSLSSRLIDGYLADTRNIKDLDLKAIAKEMNMDSSNEDIYIISEDGIIINTTFEKDLNLNLFSFGDNMKNYLLGILRSDNFVTDLFAIEHTTKRPKKYSYQPTKDHKYIIEIGAYSTQVDNVIQDVEDTKAEMKKETQGIMDLELFLMADEPFSMNKNVKEVPGQKENLLRSFQDKDTISITEKVDGVWVNYLYIYMERAKSSSGLYKGSVIRIISDMTSQKELFKTEAMKFLLIFGVTFILLTILIYRKTKVITLPIKKLVENVDRITNGDLRERAEVIGNNEVTKLSEKFNMMIAQLESYTYELEEKVKERTLRIERQKEEIEEQKKHIMDSIHYARRIQNAILPSFEAINAHLKNYFILYLPKDIVSGDFYWFHEIEGKVMIAAVDCTGHGVPGAFMSIVGYNQLSNAIAVKKARAANDILNALNAGVISTLNENTSNDSSIKDGMDMSLCVFDFNARRVEYSGANNPMIFIRDNQLTKYKADRFPIGAYIGNKPQSFTNNVIDIEKGDSFYLFSDGYADQFGGPDNRKFMSSRFADLLLEIHNMPMDEQKEILKTRLLEWRGNHVQIDDVLVIGVKV